MTDLDLPLEKREELACLNTKLITNGPFSILGENPSEALEELYDPSVSPLLEENALYINKRFNELWPLYKDALLAATRSWWIDLPPQKQDRWLWQIVESNFQRGRPISGNAFQRWVAFLLGKGFEAAGVAEEFRLIVNRKSTDIKVYGPTFSTVINTKVTGKDRENDNHLDVKIVLGCVKEYSSCGGFSSGFSAWIKDSDKKICIVIDREARQEVNAFVKRNNVPQPTLYSLDSGTKELIKRLS